MRKKFRNLLCFIGFLLICAIVLGVFYYIYLNFIKNETDIKIIGPLSINYEQGSKLSINQKGSYKITIINDSAEDAYYYIEFKNLKNIHDVTYTLTNKDDINITDDLNNYNTVISSFLLIKGGEIETYYIDFSSKEDITYNVELNVNIENLETNNFAEAILKNNEIKDNPISNIGDAATENEGLIRNTDDNGTTYYFRGNTLNNNVQINNLNFKIIRINGDGSVKLVLDGQIDTLNKYYESGASYDFKSAFVYNLLNEWADEKLGDYISYLSTQKYCNDTSSSDGYFLAYDRIKIDNIPSYICLGTKVQSKVGLLTADEVMYAGASMDYENKSFYLYNASVTSDAFLMTSAKMASDVYYPYTLSENGKLTDTSPGTSLRSIRPVITIIKTALVEGTGTIDDPYRLTNE